MNKLHDTIFLALEEYRKDHPDFLYILRTSRKPDKLESGLWFLGNQNYAWVSWIKRSNDANHSPAICLYLKENATGISCVIENTFTSETDKTVLALYNAFRDIIQQDYGAMVQKNPTYYKLEIDQTNGIDSMIGFLESTKPKIDSMTLSLGLSSILVTKEEFNERLGKVNEIRDRLIKEPNNFHSENKYWLLAPGKGAKMWDDFYSEGIIALNWDLLGDLKKYKSKNEIALKLQTKSNTPSSKRNDAMANFEFSNVMKEGDIVIAKKGKHQYLGYGIVTSGYLFDSDKPNYKSYRKVNWIKKGEWTDPDGDIVVKTLTDISKYPEYVKRLIPLIGIQTSPDTISPIKISIPCLNIILFGPPGTGKTYSSVEKALSIIDPDFLTTYRHNRKKLTSRFNELLFDPVSEKGKIGFVTFHQSMSYEDFIEGIKPSTSENELGQISYNIVPGIFKQLSKVASSREGNFLEMIEWMKNESSEADNKPPISINTGNTAFTVTHRGGKTFRIKPNLSVNPDTDYPASIENIRKMYEGSSRSEVYNPTYVEGILNYLYQNGLKKFQSTSTESATSPYVLIIDEINRGNISQIFGELITLIESDKRLGAKESLETILPYSKERFGVPSNLYIIGTMNTADRSVEALDAALRRRFSFEEMPPRYDLPGLDSKVAGIMLKDVLKTINARLEKLLDKDHKIGHSYFMFQNGADVKTGLIESFYKNIIPLLQEYFFGDYGKIGLVLGKGFVKIEENIDSPFCDFDYDGVEVLQSKPTYAIIDYRDVQNALRHEYTFDEALQHLMNR